MRGLRGEHHQDQGGDRMADIAPIAQLPWIPPEHRAAIQHFASPQELEERSWETVADRLDQARTYWLATASPHGWPHARPVFGLWLGDRLVFSLGRSNRTARDLADNPRATVHLESGEDAVIVEGLVKETSADGLTGGDEWVAKYRFTPPDVDRVAYELRPQKVFTWSFVDLPRSLTRWVFD
jgi:hypothetical protein